MVDGDEGLATGKEMTDNDVSELLADERNPAEGEKPELLSESEDIVDNDLPEGLPEEGAEQAPEPEGQSDLDRLKEMGVYRPGLIETVEDLGKSYLHIDKAYSSRPVVEKEVAPEPKIDPDQYIKELNDDLVSGENPLQAVVKVVNAMNAQTNNELQDLRSRQFVSDNPDAKELQQDMADIQQRYPGLGTQDAYNMARGSKIDTIVDTTKNDAIQNERRRETDKKQALRERPAGVRAAPVSAEHALKQAMAGKTGDEAVRAMEAVLDKQGLGLKEE